MPKRDHLIENKELRFRIFSTFGRTTKLRVSLCPPHSVYGNSIAALTVERVELLKTIVGRWSGVHDRHSSWRHATGPAAAVSDEH